MAYIPNPDFCDLNAEKAVIATLIDEEYTPFRGEHLLKPEMFYHPTHKLLIEAIVHLIKEKEIITRFTVPAYLKSINAWTGELAGIDFKDFKRDYGVVRSDLETYLKDIKKHYFSREFLKKLEEEKTNFYRNMKRDSSQAQKSLQNVLIWMQNFDTESHELTTIGEVLEESIVDLENKIRNPETPLGVSTGYKKLDEAIHALEPGNLVILAARPAMGKTAFALNVFVNAMNSGNTCIFFSMEMKKKQMGERLFSILADVENSRIKKGTLTQEEKERIYRAYAEYKLEKYQDYMEDDSKFTLTDIRTKCYQAKQKQGRLDLVVVDYLTLINTDDIPKSKNKPLESRQIVDYLVKGLKDLASEMKCTVIVLAQLNRDLERRPNPHKRPITSDIKESSGIEQAADQVLFIYRDEVYNKDTLEKGIAEIIIGKNRHGKIDTIKLNFNPEKLLFSDQEFL